MSHVIPVAFEIGGDAVTEERAAEALVHILGVLEPYLAGQALIEGEGARLDCWWTPNHPNADRNDEGEPRLRWDNEGPDGARWAVVEVMGHRRLGGLVSEETFAGRLLVRVDVPASDGDPGGAQLYGADAIFCITFTTEAVARAAARRRTPVVHTWELRELDPPEPDDDDDIVDAEIAEAWS